MSRCYKRCQGERESLMQRRSRGGAGVGLAPTIDQQTPYLEGLIYPDNKLTSRGIELSSDVDDKRVKLLSDQEALKDGEINNFDTGTIEFSVLGRYFY
ncbi:hypothetical protein E2562_015898 [Oryza meyeriana var. granulata]|uniref:Uncharacterized protein n=1 Tax=Oryza meyeriana var. granulata TaxID=110450 RepID=A0A6G1CGF5_9ORYZ|nr:hypothetical protein E2562_015898 [Oryza meyeriana var. granulata]